MVREKFVALFDHLNGALIERTEVVRGCLLAILSRKHCFLLGPPGVAKSLQIAMICQASGLRYFRRLMDRFMKPEDLYGPYKISALKADQYERAVDGYMPTAEIVNLDEVWKASGSILNTLLTIINERIFDNGQQVVKTPLITLFGASNELPENDQLNALYDRFMLRYEVADVVDDDSFMKLLKLNGGPPAPSLTKADIELAQTEVRAVVIPDEVLSALVQLRGKLKAEGFWFSPRRWRESLDVIRAQAWFDGRTSAEADDLDVLINILWDKPEDRKVISRVIMSLANPDIKTALEILDLATEIRDEAVKQGNSAAGTEANDKLKKLIGRLDKLNPGAKVSQIRDRVRELQGEVLRACLGFSI